MIARLLAVITLAMGSAVAEDSAQITIGDPFVNDRGDLRAQITNNSRKEIQIYPSHCGVEVNVEDATKKIPAKDPQLVSLISLKIPPGEAKDFTFDLIPGLTDLEGGLRLFVHAITTDPIESKTVWSERFEMADVETKTGANKPE
ncbi:MAG: hypothetical protein P1U82_24355 [Verrucomicrobiales bacterium]|nr:hypothetical protein [Verrucomicrobiales bacterium]